MFGVSKKILIITGDMVEDYEMMVPFQALLMLGHNVIAVCPNKKSGDKVKTVVHDFEGDQTYTEKLGHNFVLNGTFDQISASEFDALYLPGGRAPEYLRLDKKVLDLVDEFVKANKPIGAICHGIQILSAANCLSKKTVTCYPACQPEVNLSGGIFKDVGYEDAVVDGNFVTAAAWPAHPKFLKAFVEKLK